MTNYVDNDGNYLGDFVGKDAKPPRGAKPVPSAPDHVSQKWMGDHWSDISDEWKEKFERPSLSEQVGILWKQLMSDKERGKELLPETEYMLEKMKKYVK